VQRRHREQFLLIGADIIDIEIGEVVFLMPKDNPWAGFLESLDMFTEDFKNNGRTQDSIQRRDSI